MAQEAAIEVEGIVMQALANKGFLVFAPNHQDADCGLTPEERRKLPEEEARLNKPGEWDATTKTLTWKGDLGNGLSITAVYRFTGENTFESKVLVTGADGKTYYHLEGKAVRQ